MKQQQQRHEALFQKKILQALEFHTVPFELLAQYWGLNLTFDPGTANFQYSAVAQGVLQRRGEP